MDRIVSLYLDLFESRAFVSYTSGLDNLGTERENL